MRVRRVIVRLTRNVFIVVERFQWAISFLSSTDIRLWCCLKPVNCLLRFLLGFFTVMVGSGREFTEKEKAWWVVQPVRKVVVPKVGHAVDFFVERKLGQAGLMMSEEASAEEFVRRAYFDLHGLPPAVGQVEEFLTAWEKDRDVAVNELIDELLASPRYGERWGQHWLDVVRYADSDGYRADDFRPAAFRYRDYVIGAFNEDKPYDEFVKEQLAGDEIAASDPERVVATGFLRNGVYEWNQRNAEMQREIMINEITDVTAEVFLGMGIGCAQCHDHKFDPILQKDYFALQAFLSSVYWPDDRSFATPEELAGYQKRYRAWEEATAEIRAEMALLVEAGQRAKYNSHVKTFPPEVQEMFAKPREKQSSYERQISFLVERQAIREVETRAKPEQVLKKGSPGRLRYEELETQLSAFDRLKPEPLPKSFMSTDTGSEAAVVQLNSEEVMPGFLTLLGEAAPAIERRETTTGRRSALADWIVASENPFTARVMVNRIWQHHFGRGIAASPNDFGMLGEEPTHPELLDWLAGEFMSGGWKVKRMHKLIMTSAAYRQTARFEPSNAQVQTDPGNKLLWRFPPRRLGAEQIRDAMLALSGELKHLEGGVAQGGSSPVRSIYLRKMRNTPERVLQCFDSPAGFASEPERLNTTTPTQSLLLANSEWPLARARALAGRILGAKGSAEGGDVREAYRMVWGREAKEREVKAAMEFLSSQRKNTEKDQRAGGASDQKGLVALKSFFKGAESYLARGARGAFSLKPGSKWEYLELPGVQLPEDQFSASAVVRLDEVHDDARVNTLLSQWNGNHQSQGWSIGVTSEKSRYGPRNLIVQLVGLNPGGDLEYEVVASNLRVPLKVPVFVAVVVNARGEGQGRVTFYLKDLSRSDGEMQRVEVGHKVVGGIQRKSGKVFLGARSGGGHLWRGEVARLRLTRKLLHERDLPEFPDPVIDLNVVDLAGLPSGAKWGGQEEFSAGSSPEREAFEDFCHALLSSNEFLYLH